MKRPFVFRLLYVRNDRWIPSPKQFLCFWKNSNEHDYVWYQSWAIQLHQRYRDTNTNNAATRDFSWLQ